nr:hypothetical protein [Streptococcus equi]
MIYFNHDDIFKIIQEGYADDDNALMLETIAQALATTDIPKGDVSALNDRKTVED